MVTIQNYVRAGSLEEAYELNQKRTSLILGGMLWTKMQNRRIQTAIDLCDLGLDRIEENEEEFSIGAMVSLRQLELHAGLNEYTHGAVKKCSEGYRWSAVQKSCHCGRKHLGPLWVFGCSHGFSGYGYICGAVLRRNGSSAGVCEPKTGQGYPGSCDR